MNGANDADYKELENPTSEKQTQTTDADFKAQKKLDDLKKDLPDSYALYVLFMIVITYSSNQLNRYILTSAAKGMEEDVGFGDGSGESFLYSMLAGPVTTFPYCIGVVVAGHLADKYNKVHLLVIMVIGWCLPHAAMAFSQEYYQLALLRALSIFMSAGYVSVGPAIIADYFPERNRGLAIGVFGWAQPIGQGLVFGMGNGLESAYDWRVAIFAAGIWAVPLAFVILFTVKEKEHEVDLQAVTSIKQVKQYDPEEAEEAESSMDGNKKLRRADSTAAFDRSTPAAKAQQHIGFTQIVKLIFSNKVLICIYIAGSFKYVSTLNWQFFRNQFFINFRGLTSAQVAYYMSWIPILGGVGGGVVFGYISDRLVKRGLGAFARLLVVASIHVVAVPVILGVLLVPPYGVFAFVFMDEFLQRYFIAGINTAIIELVPIEYRVSAMSYGWMFFWIIGGNSTLLSPLIGDAFGGDAEGNNGIQLALLFLYWGGMVGAAVFLSLAAAIFYFRYYKKTVRYTEILDEAGIDKPVPVVSAKGGLN